MSCLLSFVLPLLLLQSRLTSCAVLFNASLFYFRVTPRRILLVKQNLYSGVCLLLASR